MSVSVTVNGATHLIPENFDTAWGADVTNWAVAVSAATLQKSGGTFTLTAEVDFGVGFGLKSLYYKTRTSSVADAGHFRLAVTDDIAWRNNADSGNLLLSVNGSNQITFNGTTLGDHGGLDGLADDDHSQYSLADGTRAFTGVVAGITPTGGTHLTTKAYVDSISGSLLTNLVEDLSPQLGADLDLNNFDITGQGAFIAENGTAIKPAFRFVSDANTGVYRVGENELGLAAAGNATMTLHNAWIRVDDGVTVFSPARFTNQEAEDHNTSALRPGSTVYNTDQVHLYIHTGFSGGRQRWNTVAWNHANTASGTWTFLDDVDVTGVLTANSAVVTEDLGINTTSPAARLHVVGSGIIDGDLMVTENVSVSGSAAVTIELTAEKVTASNEVTAASGTFSNSLTISGVPVPLDAADNATFQTNYSADNNFNTSAAGGPFSVTGSGVYSGDLDVQGNIPTGTFTESLTISGTPVPIVHPPGYISGLIYNRATTVSGVTISGGSCTSTDGTFNLTMNDPNFIKNTDNWAAGGATVGMVPTTIGFTTNTWYRLFLIGGTDATIDIGIDTVSNNDAGDLLAEASSVTGDTYDKYRQVGWLFTDDTSPDPGFDEFYIGTSDPEMCWWSNHELDVDVSSVSDTPTLITLSAPPNAIAVSNVYIEMPSGNTLDNYLLFNPIDMPVNENASSSLYTIRAHFDAGALQNGNTRIETEVNVDSQIRLDGSSGETMDLQVMTMGWKWNRGVG